MTEVKCETCGRRVVWEIGAAASGLWRHENWPQDHVPTFAPPLMADVPVEQENVDANLRGRVQAEGADRGPQGGSTAGRGVGDASVPLRVVQGVASDERPQVRVRAEDDRRIVGSEPQTVDEEVKSPEAAPALHQKGAADGS